jgi:DNA polymerase-3 subunit gamma/tau
LFAGPKGTGKTSAARIVAKILNCEKTSERGKADKSGFIEPCNECEQCRAITRGESLDVLELDAASHRGIDDIRQIREAVKLSAVSGRKRVYIIDEAHMLTPEAANALLKTLEEPPNHVVFILATTNPEKLPDTIRSRVAVINFKKASLEEIKKSLTRIVRGEGLKIEEEILDKVAKKAGGSFRDAAKLLEQIVAEFEDVNGEDAKEFLEHAGSFDVENFVLLLAQRKAKEALGVVREAFSSGMNSREIIDLVIDSLRNKLSSKLGVGDESFELLDEGELVMLIEIFIDAASRLSASFIEEVPIEIAIVRWCSMNLGSEDGDTKDTAMKGDSYGGRPSLSVSGRHDESLVNAGNGDETVFKNGESRSNGGSVDQDFWSKVISLVRVGHVSTNALLRAARPISFDGNTLKLGVFYKFHKEQLESKQHRPILEKAIASISGVSDIKVVCELTAPPQERISGGGDVGAKGVILEETSGIGKDSSLTSDPREDIIKVVEKIFSD